MVVTKKAGRGRGVIGGGLRDVAEFIVIKIIVFLTWELPRQIIHFLLIKWLPSNLQGPACQMVPEDFQWVGGSL
jgi:hypothetical protein